MNKEKRILAVIATLAIGAILAGCSSAPSASDASTSPSTGTSEVTENPSIGTPQELTMWFFDHPPQTDYMKKKIAEFEAENPGVTVKFNSSAPPTGTGGFEDKLNTALATGTAPDIIAAISPQATRLINSNILSPIDDAAAQALGYTSTQDYVSKHVPNGLSPWSNSEGVPFAAPWELSWLNLYCNKSLLEKSGETIDPTKPMTWDQFIEMGKKAVANNESFYKKDGKWVKNFLKLPIYQDDTWAVQVLTMFLAQAGINVLGPDGQPNMNSPQAVDAVKLIDRMSKELGDPNVGPAIPGDLFGAFSSGDMACTLAGPWMNNIFLKPTKSPVLDNYVVVALPRITEATPGNVFWGWGFGVSQQTANKELAWKLIKKFQDDPEAVADQVGLWQPSPILANSPVLSSLPGLATIASGADGGQPIFQSVNYAPMAKDLRSALEAIVLDGADVQSTLDQLNDSLASEVSQ